jgi:predicted AAA+ superfamily ATPase
MKKKKTNLSKVGEGLEIVREALVPFMLRELTSHYAGDWWIKGVLPIVESKGKKLPESGTDPSLADQLDLGAVLQVYRNQWHIVGKKLSQDEKSYLFEVSNIRNKWAHMGGQDFTADDAHRALDTMARLLERIEGESAKVLMGMSREMADYAEKEPPSLPLEGPAVPAPHEIAAKDSSLKPWRDVIIPHQDVQDGRFKQTEFAADLAEVLSGKAAPEYADPTEFFHRTYLTTGMKRFLVTCLERVATPGGEPIIQIKTAFGGGKTHALLALMHMLSGKAQAESLEGVPDLLKEAGLKTLPRANRAVLVGTDLRVEKETIHKECKGLATRTLWGEMAVQLGGATAFKFVEEADKKSVAPGAKDLAEMLDACSPSVILMDELVAYARKLIGVQDLPAGTFDNFLTFIQALTEAVKRAKNALLVVSIPESDIEKGGEQGKAAADAIEHTLGRMESVWSPVSAREAFEIVRRRLFSPGIRDKTALDTTCRAFSRLYSEHPQDFPPECREVAYLERLRGCYPIHPEIFDRLYEDWSTLEKFQRTRGVLRLMAATIHVLWERQDKGLLIMSGSVPLDLSRVRDELTRYLGDAWNPIVDSDVDGAHSEPRRLDNSNARYGQIAAAQRVARTVFLGSAASVKAQRARGIEDVRIRLGCVQPGEEISVFNDVLGKFPDRLAHFYGAGNRYWFDIPPNLSRTVEDRAQALKGEAVEQELQRRIKVVKERGIFRAVHPFLDSADIPDEMEARLVILGPAYAHGKGESEAIKAAHEILENRGTSPRHYRNMLLFLAPDRESLPALENAARRYLAWKSVIDEADDLNLDGAQRKQATSSAERADQTAASRLEETYSWLLVPTQEGTKPVTIQPCRIGGAGSDHIAKATKKAKSDALIIESWGPALLKRELDAWIWKDKPHVSVKDLWDYLARYCYLSRLRDVEVLIDAIRDGLRSKDFFAYASAVDKNGRYLGLSFGKAGAQILVDGNSVLVKPDVAQHQLEEDAKREAEQAGAVVGGDAEVKKAAPGANETSRGGTLPLQPQQPRPKRFFGSVKLSPTRLGKEAASIAEEIVAHLQGQPGAEVSVTLEIHATIPDGAPDSIVRTVTENARTLKFGSSGFEEE